MNKRLALFFLLLIIPVLLRAQASVKDSCIFTPLVLSSYAFQIPGGDLADRFGNSSSVGLSLLFKTKKNLIYGLDGSFIFGKTIRETGIFDSINTSNGFTIDGNGIFANVSVYQRGFSTSVVIGKMFAFKKPNPNSGLVLTLGTGLLQHKIRIENEGNTAPQISKDYRKGYDRLSNGISFTEFIGYYYLGNKRLVNFFGGFECIQAFTKSRRSWDYDLMRKDTKQRLDLLYGFRIGWILPLYKKAPQNFYYY